MGNYSASPRQLGLAHGIRSALAGLLAVLAAACASKSTSESQVSTSSPPPATGPVAAEPVADAGQAAAAAGDLSLRREAPLHYRVKKGDTLWGIAAYYLADPWQWPELWYANGQIKNPHLIYPGEELTLVMVNGRLRLVSGESFVMGDGKLAPRVRSEPLEEAIPAIPIDAIREFLRGPRLVTKEEIEHAPYVVEYVDENEIVGQNDDVYVKNLPDNPAPSWAVVQVGARYVDPDTGEFLGYEAIPTGEAELRRNGKPAMMRLTRSPQEVQIGDRLMPLDQENFKADFYPHTPSKDVDGSILTVYGGLTQIQQYNIVAINRGSRDGLDPGAVLNVYQRAHRVPDPYGTGEVSIPAQKAGVLMVFKVTPRVSYGLVMIETRPAHILDRVRKPTFSER